MDNKLCLILLLVVGSTLSVPIGQRSWPATSSHCQKACRHNDLQMFRYLSGKTYEYELDMQSMVQINQISGKEAKISWSALVELHYTTPCEVVLSIKSPKVQGQSYPSFTKEISEYPLKATISDGVFEDICADSREFTTVVNIKKGILSTLQNSLPSNSTMYNGATLIETDVVGVCPTNYTVKHEGSKVVVEKMKDHRLCSDRFSYGSLSPESAMFLKSPRPMKRSESKCVQEIEQGIIKSVTCVDRNELTPAMGLTKYISSEQKSTLKYKSVSQSSSVPSISQIRPTRLWYDFAIGARNVSAIPDMELKLKELSQSFQNRFRTSHTAEIYSDLIKIMNQVPEAAIESALQKIRSGQFGGESQKLEKLYLDAVAATQNNGALKIMVQKVLQKERRFQYTTAMFTFPRVCTHGINYIKPLFEQAEELPLATILAAGSVVGTYCKTEGYPYICETVPEVASIMEIISQKVSSASIEAKSNESKRKETIALLKAVGNIRRMSPQLRSTVISILENSQLQKSVRVAAAEAIKQTPCRHEVVERLLSLAKTRSESTEVRIISFKSVIECANTTQISHLLDEVTYDTNQQVRSYVLSDLLNLQKSTNPLKVEISRKLAPFNITTTFSRSIWNNSINIDYSKFLSSKLFGAELDFDIIYETAQLLPSELRSNLTLAFMKEISAFAEMGLRFENLPEILHKLVAEGTQLGESSAGGMIRNLISSFAIADSSKTGKVDYFVKFLGNDILFNSLNSKEHLERDAMVTLFEIMGQTYVQLMSGSPIERVKGYQMRYELHVPSVQGIPLMVESDLSFVGTLQAKPNPTSAPMESIVEVTPIASGMWKGFVGYKFGPSAGLKMRTKLTSLSDVKLTVKIGKKSFFTKVDIPGQSAELFKIRTESYLMVKTPGQAEQKLGVASRDPRIINSGCKSSSLFGMQICYEYDVSDLLKANDFPLVKPLSMKFTLKKSDPNVQGIQILGEKKTDNAVEAALMVLGTSQPTKLAIELRHNLEAAPRQMSLLIRKTDKTLGYKITQDRTTLGSLVQRTLEVYSGLKSHQEAGQKVFTGRLATAERRAEFQMKTLGSWAEKLNTDVDVRGSLVKGIYLEKEIDLEKFEVIFATKNYISENFIRKSTRDQSTVYVSDFNLKHQSSVVYSLKSETTHKPSQSGLDAASKISFIRPSKSYDADVVLRMIPGDNKFSVLIKRDQSTRVMALEGKCVGPAFNDRKAFVSLDMPQSEIKYKLNVNMTPSSGPDSANVHVSLKDKERVVLSVLGPLTYTWTRSSKKLDTQLGIRRYGDKVVSYHLDTKFEMSPERNMTKVVINKQNDLVLDYLHSLIWKQSEKSIISKVKVPGKVDSDVTVLVNPRQVKASGAMKAPIISPRQLKGHFTMDRNGEEAQVSSRIQWDADRTPSKQISLSGSVNMKNGEHKTMQGELTYKQEKYNYDISYLLKNNGLTDMEKDFRMDIRKQSADFITLRSIQKLAFRTKRDFKMVNNLLLKTPSGKIYNLANDLVVSEEHSLLKLKSDISMKSPRLGNVESTFYWSPKSASLIELEGRLVRSLQTSQEPSSDLEYKGTVSLDSRKSIQEVDVKVEGKLSANQVVLELSDSMRTGDSRLVVKKNQAVQLEVRSKRSESSKLQVTFKSHGMNSEIHGRFDHQEKSLQVIPSVEQRNKKFEIKYHKPSSGMKMLRVEYPHSGRQKTIHGEWNEGQESGVGKIELDVLSTKGKLMELKIKKNRYSPGVHRFEVDIVSNKRLVGPQLAVDTIFTNKEKSLVASYRKESTAPTSIVLRAGFMKVSPEAGVLSVIFSSPEGKLELGSKVQYVETYTSQGLLFNSTMRMNDFEPYLVEVLASKPAFVKIIAGRKSSTDRYVAKFGVHSYTHAELSLMHNKREHSPEAWKQLSGQKTILAEYPIAAVSAKLTSPVTLALRAQYNKEARQQFVTTARAQFTLMRQRIQPYTRAVAQKLSSEFEEKVPEMKEAIQGIEAFFKSIKEESESVKEVIRQFETAMAHVADFLDSLAGVFSSFAQTMEQYYESFQKTTAAFRQKVTEYIRSAINSLKEELNLERITYSWNILESLIDTLKGKADEIIKKKCTLQPARCSEMKQTINQVLQQLKRDLEETAKFLVKDKSVAYATSKLRRAIEMYSKEEYISLLADTLIVLAPQNIGVRFHRSGLQVNFPLRRPLGSVFLAPRFIGVQPTYMNNKFSTKSINQLTLVNGVTITLPQSDCVYNLSNDTKAGTTVRISKPGKSGYNYQLAYHANKVIIELSQKQVIVNNEVLRADQDYIIYTWDGLKVEQQREVLSVSMPGFFIMGGWKTTEFHSLVRGSSSGLVWDREIKSSDSPQRLLEKMRPYLVDPSCRS